jgi:hypothetical protein
MQCCTRYTDIHLMDFQYLVFPFFPVIVVVAGLHRMSFSTININYIIESFYLVSGKKMVQTILVCGEGDAVMPSMHKSIYEERVNDIQSITQLPFDFQFLH